MRKTSGGIDPRGWLTGLICVLVVVALVCLSQGAVSLEWGHLFGGDEPGAKMMSHLFWSIRMPRVLMAMLVGGGLAVSGASLQALFRNPLADPGLIGVSSGAALGAVGVLVFFGGALSRLGLETYAVPVAAFLGGMVVTASVLKLSMKQGRPDVATMLLAGIAVNALVGSVIGFATYVASETELRTLTLWSLGSLGASNWTQVLIVFGVGLPCVFWLLRQVRALDLLLLGEREAYCAGVSVGGLRGRIVAAVALIVGASVGFTGMIGFVGLVVPHVMRMVFGAKHKWLLPSSICAGAILLALSDLVARTVAAPAEVPIGVMTSLVGAPFFLWLLRQGRHGGFT